MREQPNLREQNESACFLWQRSMRRSRLHTRGRPDRIDLGSSFPSRVDFVLTRRVARVSKFFLGVAAREKRRLGTEILASWRRRAGRAVFAMRTQKTRLSSSALWRKARNFFIDATRGERAETVAKDKGRETRRLSARRCGRFPTCATDQCLTESENRLMTTTPAMMSPRPMYAGRSRCCLK